MFRRKLFGTLLFILIFIGSVLTFNFIQNRNRTTRAVEGYDPTMAKAYILYDGRVLNSMLGYTNTIDTSLYRESVTVFENGNQINVLLSDSVDTSADVKYELRSFDGENLIEEGDFRFIEAKDTFNQYRAEIRMNIAENAEYSMVIKVTSGKEIIRYYTRAVRLAEPRLSGFISYVDSFIDAVYDANRELSQVATDTNGIQTYNVSGVLAEAEKKEEVEKEKTYATTTDAMSGITTADLSRVFGSADVDSAVYDTERAGSVNRRGNPGYVTLTSSYEDEVFSGIHMERLTEPIPCIKEIDENSVILSLVYKTISDDNDVIKTYTVSEYMSLTYDNGAAEIKVSDYQRYVSQDFGAEGIDPASNSLCLGITGDQNPEYLSSENSKKLAFVADNSLWLYDSSTKTYSNVYGSSSDEDIKNRIPQEGYVIKLLELDDEALDFVVFGRINEGPREGSTGVALYEYSIEDTTLKELKFISSALSLDAMKLSVGEMCYFDKEERVFYLLIAENMLAIDIFSGKVENRIESLPSGHAEVSLDMKAIAYPDSSDLTKTEEITIIDFEHRTEVKKSESGHKLRLIGFVGNDVMYGAAKPDDVTKERDGTPRFLYDKLFIVKRDGTLVKKYERDNILISDVTIEDNTIYLKRRVRSEETGDTAETTKDYITFITEDTSDGVSVHVVENDMGNKETYLRFPINVYVRSGNEELFTKVSAAIDKSEYKFDGKLLDKQASFIYGVSGLRGVSDSVGKAINSVYDNGGFVVDAHGDVLYKDKPVRPYLTVAGTFDYKTVDNEEDSFAACNYMCLLAAGKRADYEEVKEKNNWIDSFDMYTGDAKGINITGVTLDTAVGYLSDGCPFAAKIKSGYVLVVSYNSDFIRYYDPMAGEEVRIQRYSFQMMCENEGNEFYTFMK